MVIRVDLYFVLAWLSHRIFLLSFSLSCPRVISEAMNLGPDLSFVLTWSRSQDMTSVCVGYAKVMALGC